LEQAKIQIKKGHS